MRGTRGCRRQRFTGLEPSLDALGIADPRVLAVRIEQHDDEWPARDRREHHETAARFADVAGLLQLDVPRLLLDERIRVVECQPLSGRLQFDEMRRRSRELADAWILRGSLYEAREIVRRGNVLGREAGGIGVVGVRHLQRLRLAVHRRNESGRAAGVVASKRRRSAVLGRHEREPQELAAGKLGAHPKA